MNSSKIPLTALIHQRLQYLNKRSEILTGNIARADIPGARRQDLRPFQTITKNTHAKVYSASSRQKDVYSLVLSARDIKSEAKEIEREMEILEMNHNSINHQALLDVVSNFYKLYKFAITRNG